MNRAQEKSGDGNGAGGAAGGGGVAPADPPAVVDDDDAAIVDLLAPRAEVIQLHSGGGGAPKKERGGGDKKAAAAAAAARIAAMDAACDALAEEMGDTPIVLLGEDTHGTREFYEARAQLTKRLLRQESDVPTVLLLESPWPETFRVNQYVAGQSTDRSARQACEGLTKFPAWMWANETCADLFAWLREHNSEQARSEGEPVKLFGVDLYSLFTSAAEVVAFLDIYDPELAAVARGRYGKLRRVAESAAAASRESDESDGEREYGEGVTLGDSDGDGDDGAMEVDGESAVTDGAGTARRRRRRRTRLDPNAYGAAAARLGDAYAVATQAELTSVLAEVQRRAHEYAMLGVPGDELLSVVQNAECVVAAEEYYRKNHTGDNVGWSIRDQHMTHTVLRVREHFAQLTGRDPRVIVWAHNSHVGDGRASECARRGEWNLGQMVRQTFGRDAVYTVGFGTHRGHVTAAQRWGSPGRRVELNPSMEGSYGGVMHRVAVAVAEAASRRAAEEAEAAGTGSAGAVSAAGKAIDGGGVAVAAKGSVPNANAAAFTHADLMLRFRADGEAAAALEGPRLERMVGVVYDKPREREQHYLECSLPGQFDAWVHFDATEAVAPLAAAHGRA